MVKFTNSQAKKYASRFYLRRYILENFEPQNFLFYLDVLKQFVLVQNDI
jgi:hypothetical protein